jgi:hypothetical protein
VAPLEQHPRRRAEDIEGERERIKRRVETSLVLRIHPIWTHQFVIQTVCIVLAIWAMPSFDWRDVMRGAFIGSGIFYLGLAVMITAIYADVQEAVEGHAELLPRHVRWTVAGDAFKTIGFILIVVAITSLGPAWEGVLAWLSGLGLVMATAGITAQCFSLGIMWRFQLSRMVGKRLKEGTP